MMNIPPNGNTMSPHYNKYDYTDLVVRKECLDYAIKICPAANSKDVMRVAQEVYDFIYGTENNKQK